jgi:hypothetical protein
MNKGVSRKSLAKLKETKLPKKRKSHRYPRPIEGAMTVKTKKIITVELVETNVFARETASIRIIDHVQLLRSCVIHSAA